jgi:SNF2 family DNA or RNA helicase
VSDVQATRDGPNLLVKFPYSANDVSLVKKVGGGRWSKTEKIWKFRLSWEACLGLREVFGDRLVVMPPLVEWAREEKRRREELEAIRDGATDIMPRFVNLPRFAPLLYSRLSNRPYQMTGVAFALTGGNVLLGDQPGTGKTYQALGAVVESGAKRVLIICPRTAVRTVWESHINELLPGYAVPYVAQGSRAEREKVIGQFDSYWTSEPRILIVNHEMVRVKRMYRCMVGIDCRTPTTFILSDQPEFKSAPGTKGGCYSGAHKHSTRFYPEYDQLFDSPWDMIIMDESHKSLASTSNKQSKNITQVRLGAVRLPLKPGGNKLAVSATPHRSKANKAWGTLNWLQPDVFSSYWTWAKRYFNVDDSGYGAVVSEIPDDPDKFRDAMRPYMIARTKADVAPDLPPIQYAGTAHPLNPDSVGVWLPLDPAQEKAYKDMVSLAQTTLGGKQLTAVGVLAEITRMKQFACSSLGLIDGEWYPSPPSNKLDWIMEFLEERDGYDGKVVIASQFTRLLHMVNDALKIGGYKSMMLTGETSDKGRENFVRRFQDTDDDAKIGLINMFAGGESITLDAADDMILLDLPWTDSQIEQVESRIHRISRIHQVTVYRLLSIGTIDEQLAVLTQEQRELIKTLTPEARSLLKEIIHRV